MEPCFQTFSLQCQPQELVGLSSRYAYQNGTDDRILEEIRPRVEQLGYIPYDDFLLICGWKTQRSKSRVRKNSPEMVEEASAFALTAKEEKLRVETFTLLEGVGYPTASVFLHFLHPEPYPILDFRALETLGIKEPKAYRFSFWWEYVQFTRGLAQRLNIDMRTLDRGLWQWSLENPVSKAL